MFFALILSVFNLSSLKIILKTFALPSSWTSRWGCPAHMVSWTPCRPPSFTRSTLINLMATTALVKEPYLCVVISNVHVLDVGNIYIFSILHEWLPITNSPLYFSLYSWTSTLNKVSCEQYILKRPIAVCKHLLKLYNRSNKYRY